MGLLSAGLTAFYIRDSSLLPSLSDLPPIPRFPNPRAFVSGSTVFFGAICLIVILILAYVTNPSESSFRTFLTEQAFRRHLHKLQDEHTYGDEESLDYEPATSLNRIRKGRQYGLPRHKGHKPPPKPSINSLSDLPLNPHARNPRFHFANHLGVALQTPSHIFKSYGLFTIAVTQQVDTTSTKTCLNSSLSHRSANAHGASIIHAQNGRCTSDHPGHCETGGGQNTRIRGTWYVGAFGKWWIGGELAFLKEDLVQSFASTAAASATFEGDANRAQIPPELKSGQYEVKALDQVDAFSGLPIKSDIVSSRVPSPLTVGPSGSSGEAKTRSRASTRSVKQTATPLPSRGSTPPPTDARILTAVVTPNKANGNATVIPNHKQDISTRKSKSRSNSNADTPKSSINATEESSHPPDVVKMLQEITKSQATVQELRDQLSSFQQQAFASHATLRITLDEYRTKKKQEDAARIDLKTRMKTLEESKRHADTGKRDAEKKMKTAQGARDSAISRMQRLSIEKEDMRKRMETDEDRVLKSKADVMRVEDECNAEMERKKGEVKSLEETINTLSTKAKELEESLAGEKELFATLKKDLEEKKQLHQQHQQAALTLALQIRQRNGSINGGYVSMEDLGLGPTEIDQQQNWTGSMPVQNHTHNISSTISPPFNSFEPPNPYGHHPRRPSAEIPLLDDVQSATLSQSRLRSASLGALSSMGQNLVAPVSTEVQQSLSPGDGGFLPFDLDDRNHVMHLQGNPSFSSLGVSTTGLLPSNLVNSMETESPLSVIPTSSNNTRESRWRPGMWPFKSDLSKSTPASSHGGKGFDPFDSNPPSTVKSLPMPEGEATSHSEVAKPTQPGGRRWFSRSTSEMNGISTQAEQLASQVISAPENARAASKSRLNPDAKVFSLPRERNLLSNALWTEGMAIPPLNVRSGSLHLLSPPPEDFTSSFSSSSSLPVSASAPAGSSTATAPRPTKPRFRGLFSSPFAPSPAEREALQRALEKNLSHDRISITSDGSGENSSMRLPPSPFGLPQPNASLFDVDEEESDAGWGSVLKSASGKDSAGESMARQMTR